MTPLRTVLLCLLVAASLAPPRPRCVYADGEEGEATVPAFVELDAPHDTYFVGEVVLVTVRVGLDATYLPAAFPADGPHALVPLVRRPLDVPLHVDVPLLRRQPGALALPARRSAGGTDASAWFTLALNDEAVAFRREREVERRGVRYAVLSSEHRIAVEREGPLYLAPATLRAVVATRFREDLVLGRTPEDPRPVSATDAPRTWTVRPLPTEGRPDDFSGAIGRFVAEAALDPGTSGVGAEALRVRWRLRGPGNLNRLGPLRPPPLPGVHVLGALETVGDDERVVTLDVTLDPSLRAFPSIPWVAWDPTPPGAYVIVATKPLEWSSASRGDPRATSREAQRPREGVAGWGTAAVVVGGGVVLLTLAVVLGARRAARRRASRPLDADPRVARTRAALAALDRTTSDPADHDLSAANAALVEVVAARLGTGVGAVLSSELAARLQAVGVRPALAHETAEVLEGLVRARYGGGDGAARPAEWALRLKALAEAWVRDGRGRAP